MIDFNSKILKAISNYKLILRKSLPAAKCASKMHDLGIKRQYIRKADELKLYQIGLKIKDELKKQVNTGKDKKSSNYYHGASEFLQYLEDLYVNYAVGDNRVVHVGLKISCVLVEAIQLITLSEEKLAGSKMRQVVKYGAIIATHGTREQKKMFLKAINSRQKHLIGEFSQETLVGFEDFVIKSAD